MDQKNIFLSDDVRKPVRFVTNSRDMIKLYAYPVEDWISSWPHNPTDFRYLKLFILESSYIYVSQEVDFDHGAHLIWTLIFNLCPRNPNLFATGSFIC